MHCLVLVSVLTAVAASVGAQYSMKFLVDAIAAGPGQMDAVWAAVGLFSGLVAADHLLWRVAGWAAARTFPLVGVDLRLDLFKHLVGHSVRYFGERFAGALANRITAAATAVFTIETALAWNVLPPAAAILGALISLVAVEWHMASALAAAVVLIAGALAVAAIRGRPLHLAFAGRAADVGGEIVDVVSNHSTVRAFAAAEREHQRLKAGLTAEASAHRRSLFYMERMRLAHALCVGMLGGSMLVWAASLWGHGRITAGDVVVVGTFSLALLQASRDLAVALVEITHHWGRLGDAISALTVPHDMPDRATAVPLVRQGGSIAFEEVTFAYSGGRKVLDRIRLDIPAGEKVGIVGPSGAGKTTLLALVQRLYPVAFGHVLVDGQDVVELTQESLRRSIAVVPQEVSLFHRSVIENIRYGKPDASDAEVFAAARAARCDDFIRELPEGYGTLVGERGVRLSGGQRQRVGIARAILKDAPILLLDEATSSLDSASEIAIQRGLEELMRGRTVLAVAHRLSTVAAFDRIIVLQNGRIVEDGAPDELCRRNGAFGAMWRVQMGEVVLGPHYWANRFSRGHQAGLAEPQVAVGSGGD